MGANFVDSGKRRLESIRGLRALGIGLERQHYAGLADSRLKSQVSTLAGNIIDLANRNGLDTVISFGANGFDGHDDHKATYAATALASVGIGLRHITRTLSPSEATLEYTGDPELKFSAMALHTSQYDPTSSDFESIMRPYIDQLGHEMYATL